MKNIYIDHAHELCVRTLMNADYEITHNNMLNQTLQRIEKKKQNSVTNDELWVVEHNDVYTLGQAGKQEHILKRSTTPIIHTDRGGQVTWHGKGQLVVYWLFDLGALGWSVRDLVSHAEQSIEDVLNDVLANTSIENHSSDNLKYIARARKDAPGVYIYSQLIDEEIMLGKIASLGFKIKLGFSYHGIALNLNCDLSAFNAINPCGYAGMQMLRLADFVPLPPLNIANAPNKSKIAQDLTPDLSTKTRSVNGTSVNGTSEDTESISNLQITQRLINNIKQRQAGDIPLRLASD